MADDEYWLSELRQFRKDSDLTQQEVATLLGVAQRTVSRWEAGTAQPAAELADRLRVLVGRPNGDLRRLVASVRAAAVPIALVDDRGAVLAASKGFRAAHPTAEPAAMAEARGGAILLVADDPVLRKGLRAVLRNWGLASVVAAEMGEALVRAAGGPALAAAIVEAGGGDDGALGALRTLRTAMAGLPVVVLVDPGISHGVVADAAEDLAIIGKPLDLGQLRSALASLLPGLVSLA